MRVGTPDPADAIVRIVEGNGPLVAAAVHAGGRLRPEVAERLALGPEGRRREEDPFTDRLTAIAPTRIVALRSRFEVDLNRPRDGAVYRRPENAWGLRVWESREGPPEDLVRRSLALYDEFYARVERLLERKRRRHGAFVVFDLHSYNHRREGPDGPSAPAAGNPDVNLGTGSMDRERWRPVVDALARALRERDVGGRPLDVRENVRFRGGHFPGWVHRRFPGAGCAPAIELKKTFMDEWTGELHPERFAELREALQATVEPVREALESCRWAMA